MVQLVPRSLFKKITAIFLSLVLALSSFPASVFATPGDVELIDVGDYAQNIESCVTENNSGISDDGRYIVLRCITTTSDIHLFLKDRASGITHNLGDSRFASMSPDGNLVLISTREQLNPVDTDDLLSLYLLNRTTNSIELVSSDSSGIPANSSTLRFADITSDGKFIAFLSDATNLVENDLNNELDIFVKNLETGEVRISSVNAEGSQLDDISSSFCFSSDGSYLVYRGKNQTDASYALFLHNINTGTSSKITDSNGVVVNADSSSRLSMSGDGKYVAFISREFNLVPNDTNNVADVFVHNREDNSIQRVNTNSQGEQSNASGIDFDISGDGNYLIFSSRATNLVPNVDDGVLHLYRKDLSNGETEIVDSSSSGELANNQVINPSSISSNGQFISFNSSAKNLSTVNPYTLQVFVKEMGISDINPPSISGLNFSTNPKSTSETSVLSANVNDESDIAQVEYFIGNDPGVGNGADMFFDGTTATVTIGTDMPVGVYPYSVRALDNAGNWSDPVTVYLTVYDPSGGFVTATHMFTPSLAAGDILPGLISPNQTTQATFGATVKYQNGSLQGTNNDFGMSYQVGNGCQSPNSNCTGIVVDSTSISWLILTENNTKGTIQGTADVTVNGTTTSNPYKVEVYSSGHATTPNYIVVKIFAPGADPNTATPLYKASGNVTGNILVEPI